MFLNARMILLLNGNCGGIKAPHHHLWCIHHFILEIKKKKTNGDGNIRRMTY